MAILVQNPKQLPVVLKTCEEMLAGEGFPVSEATIVVCGQAVQSLQRDSDEAALIGRSAKNGVRVTACGISLDKLKVRRDRLVPEVQVVTNGLVELLKLQKRGFHSIEL